jgi:uncharacterized protein YkwD
MRLTLAALLCVVASQFAFAENRLIRTECDGKTCRRVTIGSEWEYRIVDLVNGERRQRGLRPLAVAAPLMNFARSWSGKQANQRRMYHSGGPYGENVAYGQRDPAEVMRAWMNSPGHRANILNGRYSTIGVGVVVAASGQPYYTQVFR